MSQESTSQISQLISDQLKLPIKAVQNTVKLLTEGATVPFISRYRKEATGSLDEVAVLDIENSLVSLKDLIKRKAYILSAIADQDKLSPSLKQKIEDCWSLSILEDLYLPYKKKRKTRASLARQNGLQGLADIILDQRAKFLERETKQFFNQKVKDVESALSGARDIIAEQLNEAIEIREIVRRLFSRSAVLSSKLVQKKKSEAIKYKDYFDFSEPLKKSPAHRLLAVYRGDQEGFLKVKIEIDIDEANKKIQQKIINRNASYECEDQLILAIKDALKRLLGPSIETEFKNLAKERADKEAISVFSENLKQLLLAPPLGNKRIMGIDPGFRSGCKVVCLNDHGDLLYNTTIYPHPPQNETSNASTTINSLIQKYQINAVAIGNGTAGKETQHFIKSFQIPDIEIFLVNENGASIYSASEIARSEFPDHDLTVRGAVSIARRLMDPLSELVKIDPKSIGVGQYQHDVNQVKLKADLTKSVEYCVNAIGIDLNTASEHVLTYISGLGPTLAKNIVQHRSQFGKFDAISKISKVPRMGAKAFEQCAGFLRIRNGKNPLDNTGVHPERYALVRQIAKDHRFKVEQLINNIELIEQIDIRRYISDTVGLPTLKDIIQELKKPGHDIRGQAETFDFTSGVDSIEDLYPEMMVKGVINNITKFGAFVDIGIKEAGLIHISQLSDRFVSDPLKVVKLNQQVNARVLSVDIDRKRISLSLKSN